MIEPPAQFEWPPPWQPFADGLWREWAWMQNQLGEFRGDSQVPDILPGELQRECCSEHPLYGRTCIPVAESLDDPNEYLFITDNPAFPIAFAHLTWSRETTPAYPYTIGYGSWEEFRLAWTRESDST